MVFVKLGTAVLLTVLSTTVLGTGSNSVYYPVTIPPGGLPPSSSTVIPPGGLPPGASTINEPYHGDEVGDSGQAASGDCDRCGYYTYGPDGHTLLSCDADGNCAPVQQ